MTETKSKQRETCETLFGSMIKQDFDTFATCLTDDIFYRVGSSEPIHGKQGVIDFLKSFYTQVQMQVPETRQVIELPEKDQVIFEFETNYLRLKDNKVIHFACTDVMRMAGDKIKEWRVYVDISPLYRD